MDLYMVQDISQYCLFLCVLGALGGAWYGKCGLKPVAFDDGYSLVR